MSLTSFVQGRIDSAGDGFGQYEADYPEMRRDWWENRAHRGPVSEAPAAFGAFLMALGQATVANPTSADFNNLVEVIDHLHNALTYHPEQKISKTHAILKGVAVAMHVKKRHANFLRALMNLRAQVTQHALYQPQPDYSRYDY